MLAKLRKTFLVVFITCLIWVWADLSLEDVLENQTVTISASRANPRLWVTIEGKTEVQVKADITGSRGRIQELSEKINSGKERLEVILDAEAQNMDSAGQYKLQDVRNFLADNKKIRQYGLGIKTVLPETLDVRVVELSEKSLPVKCIDQSDNEITSARISPDIVTVFAPENVTEAKVKIASSAEAKQARGSQIEKRPYIELAAGQIQYADSQVKVALPITEQNMKPHTISGTLGFIFSGNLVGEYKVEFTKRPETGSILIIATEEAKAAYEEMPFEVLLEIRDDDVNKEEVTREVIYNFPAEYVRQDKIRLEGSPVEAKFKLVSVSAQK